MEIGPIPRIGVITPARERSIDPELKVVFDIESVAKAGDDTYTGSGRKAAGAEENDEDEQDPEETADGQFTAGPREESPGPKVNFFA